MGGLSAWLPYVQAAGTVLNATSQIQQGKERRQEQLRHAEFLKSQATAAQAESQREAAIERKRARNLMSRAQALAAASGGGTDNITVENILTDIGTQGEVHALNALYSGNSTARGLRRGAQAARNEGNASRRAGYMGAASTALDGGVSWYEKYGA